MPELALFGLVGAVVTFLAVNFNLFWVHRTFRSPGLRILNHNLLKVNRYWSHEQGRIREVPPEADQRGLLKRDYQKSTRSAFLFGTLLIFLSWAGLVLFAIYFISIHWLAKSRLEIRIFESELVKNPNLDQKEVLGFLVEIGGLGD